MALDPAAFGMENQFADTAARVFDEMRASKPLPGHDPVRMPGEGKHDAAEQRRRNGLQLNPALHQDLLALAELYGFDATIDLST